MKDLDPSVVTNIQGGRGNTELVNKGNRKGTHEGRREAIQSRTAQQLRLRKYKQAQQLRTETSPIVFESQGYKHVQ